MRFRALFAACAVAFSVLTPDTSEASWTKAESFEFSAKTSLKITDPVDAHVFVTIGNETKESTLPAIFPLPDQDAYIQVKIVGKDGGDPWNGQIEVKDHKPTVVKFTQAAGPAPARARPPRRDPVPAMRPTKGPADPSSRAPSQDRPTAYETTLEANKAQSNIELAPGKYSVRIFKNGTFLQAKELEVNADGWVFMWGCKS